MHRFNAIFMKIPTVFLTETDKLMLKSIWKFKGSRRVKIIFPISKITTKLK